MSAAGNSFASIPSLPNEALCDLNETSRLPCSMYSHHKNTARIAAPTTETATMPAIWPAVSMVGPSVEGVEIAPAFTVPEVSGIAELVIESRPDAVDCYVLPAIEDVDTSVDIREKAVGDWPVDEVEVSNDSVSSTPRRTSSVPALNLGKSFDMRTSQRTWLRV